MGSTTPPESSHDRGRKLSTQQASSEVTSSDELANRELLQLLESRESEIRRLRSELDKYKSAVKNFKIDQTLSDDEDCFATEVIDDTVESILHSITSLTTSTDQEPQIETSIPKGDSDLSEEKFSHSSQIPRTSDTALESSGQSLVVVDDGDQNDGSDLDTVTQDIVTTLSNDKINIDADLRDIIHDVREIDLNSNSGKTKRKRKKHRENSNERKFGINCDTDDDGKDQHDDNEHSIAEVNKETNEGAKSLRQEVDNDDLITDGLLTSLTDAAISNLSQLAALQERCESQQQHSQQQKQQQQKSLTQEEFQSDKHNQSLRNRNVFAHQPSHSGVTPNSRRLRDHQKIVQQEAQDGGGFLIPNPFTPSNIANQAAIALGAASGGNPVSSLLAHQINVRSSPTGATAAVIKASQELGSSQSLTSAVVAAAAAAAEAAEVDEQPSHKQPHHHSQQQVSPSQQQQHLQLQSQQSRLISSAIASPDFYQSLHQQASLVNQIPPPMSTLCFSPSITSPSPTSLFGGSLAHHSRMSMSNNSSNILSPIASPNYLRRQLVSDRALSIMSPSPPTSLVTAGGSSGIGSSASSTHMLQMAHQHHHSHNQQHHHHHSNSQQQRSASALAGPISSSSTSTGGPLSGGAVSPLLASKNSSQARLNNMQIRHKFGYLGSSRGQFNSPHGFCLGPNQEIVVADTNNHRVCIFDKGGTFIAQFGSPGKEEGQLWNPRKVAILHRTMSGGSGCVTSSAMDSSSSSGLSSNHRSRSGSATTFSSSFTSGGGIQSTASSSLTNHFASEPLYVVCDRGAERSRMQLFTKDGAFIKKIGIHYIDIVAGLAITQNGLIIVVDSVSPTVYIINAETGILNGWFDCSGHMKEPSDIAVKANLPGNEYFICDFKGHCVVVFSEQGDYLRKIGHDGLTSYPNGIDISDDGDILVGDSHGNRFHVVVFDRNGNFVSQFECPHVKVSRCCGLKITREGYIVTLAKNNHHVLVLDTIHI